MSAPESTPSSGELGERLRVIREEIYGVDGVAELARLLGISARTWTRYEGIGELASAQVLLRFIELTGVDPLWLLKGEGPRYRHTLDRRPEGAGPGDGAPTSSQLE